MSCQFWLPLHQHQTEFLRPFPATSGATNIAFACALQLGETTECVDLLLSSDRAPEAALFARTYAPSQVPRAVTAWKKDLEKRPKLATAIANPLEDPNEFEGWEESLAREAAVVTGAEYQIEDGQVEEEGGEEEAIEYEHDELTNGVHQISLDEPEPEHDLMQPEDVEELGKSKQERLSFRYSR